MTTLKQQKPHLNSKSIDSHAFGIVRTLKRAGFTTYLVGGCVRDLLIGIEPKDFDIATSAHPHQVKRLISMAFIIGKRFRLVLVKRDELQYEVSTFRKNIVSEEAPAVAGAMVDDNLYGSPNEDALRRDFTINGLFYDPVQDVIIDYVDGIRDIRLRVIRMIGDPQLRLEEDPIRIMRALRLAHKIEFSLDPELRQAIIDKAETLKFSVLPRRREEILKWLKLEQPSLAFAEAFDLGVLKYVLPTLHDLMVNNPESSKVFMDTLDLFLKKTKGVSDPVQLFGALSYSFIRAQGDEHFTKESFDQENFQAFLRDEVGLYKLEQLTLMQSVHLIKKLQDDSEFGKQPTAQQTSLLKRDGFALALLIAEADHWISPYKIERWMALIKTWGSKIHTMEVPKDDDKRPKRRRRRKKIGEPATPGELSRDSEATSE